MKKQIIPVAVVFVILLAGLALWFGLREGGSVARSGDAGVDVLAPAGTQIITVGVDENGDPAEATPQVQEVPDSGELSLELESGTYQVLASRGESYYPWEKEIVVTEDTSTELYPILFPVEANLEAVDESSEEYAEVSEKFATSATLPTSENPISNDEGSAEAYVDGSTIYVSWTGDIENMPEFICPGENVEECREQPIYSFEQGGVENIQFFGERDEILILDRGTATPPSITALEVDRRGTSNQQPIYVDATPNTGSAFRIVDDELYISDGGVISRVVLD